MMMRERQGMHLAWALAAALSLSACGGDEENKAAQAGGEAVQAHVLTLAATTLPEVYATSGVVTSDHRVAVGSRLSGYIREITVREGERVRKGQLLFRVDPVDARQAYEQALADLRDAENDLKRFRSLLAEHAVSQQQFDKVKLRYTVAKSKLVQAKNQLRYAEVKAPVNGVVVEKRANVGDLAAPGNPVLVIEDPNSLLVETHVSEQYISALREGDAARVWLPSAGRGLTGHVRQIVKAADPVTHQFLVKLALDEREGVLPGMFVEVRFAVGSRKGVLLPAAAIVRRAGLTGAYVLDEAGVAHYRLVRLGQRRGDAFEVLAGLHAGERIAWREDGGLRSGARVTPARAAKTQAAEAK